jgi:hypothetical protein
MLMARPRPGLRQPLCAETHRLLQRFADGAIPIRFARVEEGGAYEASACRIFSALAASTSLSSIFPVCGASGTPSQRGST